MVPNNHQGSLCNQQADDDGERFSPPTDPRGLGKPRQEARVEQRGGPVPRPQGQEKHPYKDTRRAP